MQQEGAVTLFVGPDSDSKQALKVVTDSGIETLVINSTSDLVDFDMPLLFGSTGVFEGLQAIIWFVKVAEIGEIPDGGRLDTLRA